MPMSHAEPRLIMSHAVKSHHLTPMSHTVISLTNQVRKARHLVRLMTQNSESCAKVIHHMTHKCASWKHHKSHTYEIQNPMTHNRKSYETISSLRQIIDI